MKRLLMLCFLVLIFFEALFARMHFNKCETKKTNSSYETAVGFQNINRFKLCILANGSFHNVSFFGGAVPFSLYRLNQILRIYNISLVVGISSGPWSPTRIDPSTGKELPVGPTVSESISRQSNDVINNGDFPDWDLPRSNLSQFLNPLFRISDLYNVMQFNSFYLLPISAIPQTWPKNIYGFRFWPGKRKLNRNTGRLVPDSFVSDNDIYFQMTDDDYANHQTPGIYPGYSLHLLVKGESYAFRDSYAQNIVFFDMLIINQSRWNYKNLFIGVFHDFDIFYNQSPEEWPDFILSEKDNLSEKPINYNLSFVWDRNYFATHFSQFRDTLSCAGITFLETPPSPPNDGIDNDHDGIVDESEGEQLGITRWHNFQHYSYEHRNGQLIFTNFLKLPEREKIEYAVLSGDITGLDSSWVRRLFHPDSSGSVRYYFDNPNYFYGVDRRDLDAMPLPATGPISLASGDTVHFAFAVVAGTNLEDLKKTTRIAHRMYDHGYRRAGGPPPPHVTAVPGDKRVTLYWDNSSEASPDPITGYRNFEGYRIYRTTANPQKNQWGEPRLDDHGKLVGFVPIAQFDKKDGIVGLDSLYPHMNLGNDSGLRYTWTDTTVRNGVTYYYSVTAYDYGIRSDPELNPENYPPLEARECSRGTDPDEAVNLVEVTPGGAPPNAVFPEAPVRPLPENKGNTLVEARVIDPFHLTGDAYRLTIGKDRGGWYFDLLDETTGELKLSGIHRLKGQKCPVVDGLQPWVFRFDTLGILQDSTHWVRADGSPSDCNWKIIGWASYKKAVYDYEIHFKSEVDTGCVYHKTAPFEVWNSTLGKKLQWDILIDSPKDTSNEMKSHWTDGDFIMTKEMLQGLPHFTWWLSLRRNPRPVVVERDSIIRGHHVTVVDTEWVDIPPRPGDILKIVTMKPGWAGDSYRISTEVLKTRQAESSDLAEIRVVPNPYVVRAEWETTPEEHRVEFTHLPSDCEIKIYTVWGGFVRKLEHHSASSGGLFWNLRNSANMDVAYGLYLYTVTTPDGKRKAGKFAIVR